MKREDLASIKEEALKKAEQVKDYVKYQSPITIVHKRETDRLNQDIENAIYSIIPPDIVIDKESLLEALKADKKRYEKAYKSAYYRGFRDGCDAILDVIKNLVQAE